MNTNQTAFEKVLNDLILHGEATAKEYGRRTLIYVRNMASFKEAIGRSHESNSFAIVFFNLNGYILREVCLKTFVFEKHTWDNPPRVMDREHAGNVAVGQYVDIDGEYCMGVATACNSLGEDGMIVRTNEGRLVFVEMSELMEEPRF